MEPKAKDRKCGTVLFVADDRQFARELVSPSDAFARRRHIRRASNVSQALGLLQSDDHFDGALVDLDLPGGSGLDILAAFRRKFPEAPAVLLTAQERHDLTAEAYSLNAGYLFKRNLRPTLALFFERLFIALHSRSERERQLVEEFARANELSPRQTQVFALAAAGIGRKQIASELGISISSVKHHVHAILERCHELNIGDVARQLRRQESGQRGVKPEGRLDCRSRTSRFGNDGGYEAPTSRPMLRDVVELTGSHRTPVSSRTGSAAAHLYGHPTI